MRINKFALLTIPGDFKRTVYQKNLMGHYIPAYKEQLTTFIFPESLLSAYMENTLNDEKSH
jgi:hypothetical protein